MLPEEELRELTEERPPLREAVVPAERDAADTPERDTVEAPEREVALEERVVEEARVVRLPDNAERTLEPPEETVPVRTVRELLPTRELRAVPTRVEVTLRTSERNEPPRAL